VQENQERWLELCALAAKEQDPTKLLALTQEINRLWGEKARRLTAQPPAATQNSEPSDTA
jgi:hypothetical protein